MTQHQSQSKSSKKQYDSNWTSRPERGTTFMLQVMSWISLHLGRTISRSILHLITTYFLLFSRVSRRASRDYLRRVLRREPKLIDLYKHIFTFATTIHDRVYLINNRYDLFDITVHNEQIIHDMLAQGRGAFLIGAHLGSFEVTHAMGRRHPDLQVIMVMFEENARKINSMLAAINPAIQQEIIPLGHIDTMLKVRDRLNDGSVLSILADRTLDDDMTLEVPFIDQLAPFPIGPFRMAALLDRPVIFMTGLYLGGNRYSIHFEQLADFSEIPAADKNAAIQSAIKRYAALMEKYCRSAPYNWFNFFDFWQPARHTKSLQTR